MHDDPQPAEAVEVYWRPGCGFCSTLRRDLHRTGLPLREINIWNDQDAATLVRRAAGGSETVPTVVIGPHALVSPTVDEVMAAVAAHAPHLLPTQQPPAPRARVSGRGWLPLALALVAVGSGFGLWAASRPARRSDGPPPAKLNTGPGPLNPAHPFPADAPRSRIRTRTSCEDTGDVATRPAWVNQELFPFESHFVEVDGARIHYIDEGQGPVFLGLHGNPTWSFLYRHIVNGLKHRFRCIALDYPGFGLSTAPPGYRYTIAEHSRVVEGFVTQLGLEGITPMVQDWGAGSPAASWSSAWTCSPTCSSPAGSSGGSSPAPRRPCTRRPTHPGVARPRPRDAQGDPVCP